MSIISVQLTLREMASEGRKLVVVPGSQSTKK